MISIYKVLHPSRPHLGRIHHCRGVPMCPAILLQACRTAQTYQSQVTWTAAAIRDLVIAEMVVMVGAAEMAEMVVSQIDLIAMANLIVIVDATLLNLMVAVFLLI